MPNHVHWRSGNFSYNRQTSIRIESGDRSLADRLREALGKPEIGPNGGPSEIVLLRQAGLPAEGYTLDVAEHEIHISATSDGGLFNGIQTLRQLNQNGEIAECHIEDAPRFGWRGL